MSVHINRFTMIALLLLALLGLATSVAGRITQADINLADWNVKAPLAITPGQFNNFTFDRPEGTREFFMYVPSKYDPKQSYPFTFYFHGYSADWTQGPLLNMTQHAESRGWIYVFGRGTPSTTGLLSWNGGVCCKFPNSSSQLVDDVMFTRIALKIAQGAVNIDPTRIYTTGWSNGGFMSERLACEAPELWAAVAADASAVGKSNSDSSASRSLLSSRSLLTT